MLLASHPVRAFNIFVWRNSATIIFLTRLTMLQLFPCIDSTKWKPFLVRGECFFDWYNENILLRITLFFYFAYPSIKHKMKVLRWWCNSFGKYTLYSNDISKNLIHRSWYIKNYINCSLKLHRNHCWKFLVFN